MDLTTLQKRIASLVDAEENAPVPGSGAPFGAH